MTTTNVSDRLEFENVIRALEAQVANAGTHFSLDASTRSVYSRKVNELAAELHRQASTNQITWHQAAHQASEARNIIMDTMRWRSSPLGRAMAQNMKSQGLTLNEIIARKVLQTHGRGSNFNNLTASQKNHIYEEIVCSAGKASREAAMTGSGVIGGFAGGAIAGLACGPGALACVAIGAFAGGALAAFSTATVW